MNIVIKGVGMTPFGELWDQDLSSLAVSATQDALKDSGYGIDDIDVLVVGNMLSPYITQQSHLGSYISESLGFSGPSLVVEAACASGGMAVRQGFALLMAGMAKRVLVLGVEKMTDVTSGEIASFLMGASSSSERQAGATFPSLYGMMHRMYQHQYGISDESMCFSAIKNHAYGALNPKAHFRNLLTVDQILASPFVSDPIRQLHCSGVSDGGVAVILESQRRVRSGEVEILASSHAGDSISLSRRKSLISLLSTKMAMKKALHDARISRDDIDVVELHDCFSVAECMALEDMGFAPEGKATYLLEDGFGKLGSGGLAINTSGGLKACGHPVGATGVKQLVEVHDQLLARCEERQAREARVGLTHNVGGTGATATIHLLRRQT